MGDPSGGRLSRKIRSVSTEAEDPPGPPKWLPSSGAPELLRLMNPVGGRNFIKVYGLDGAYTIALVQFNGAAKPERYMLIPHPLSKEVRP